MKKKSKIIGIILAFAICLFPLPRKVDCKTENIAIEGFYFDFLFLHDRFMGKAMIDGQEYEPYTDYSARKLPVNEGYCYMIGVYRYRAETDSLDLETLYLKENLKELEIKKCPDNF